MTLPNPGTDRVAAVSSDPGRNRYLAFRCGAAEYGVDVSKVLQIRGYQIPAHVTKSDEFIEEENRAGGTFAPIFDLRLRRMPEDASVASFAAVIFVDVGGLEAGLRVDSVSEVLEFAPAQIEPVPDLGLGDQGWFLKGLGCVTDAGRRRQLFLIDLERLRRTRRVTPDETAAAFRTGAKHAPRRHRRRRW